jgi:hypothetical protein
MAHSVLDIPGGSTRFENCPEVTFTGGGNTSVSITVTYRATERTEDAPPRRGQLMFSDVLEFRWVEDDVDYEPYPQHANDFEFGLIEILDSAYVEAMAANSGWPDHVGLRIRLRPESEVRHFRFSADEWGTLDIIATQIAIRWLDEAR